MHPTLLHLLLPDPPPRGQPCLARLLDEHRISHSGFARLARVPRASLLGWLSGKHSPTAANLLLLARAVTALGWDPSTALAPEGSPMTPSTPSARAHLRLVGANEPAPTPTPAPQEDPDMATIPREYLTAEELERFELTVDPFFLTEPGALWLGEAQKAISEALWSAVQRQQIVALVAPPGAGKSTILRALVKKHGNKRQVRFCLAASLDRSHISHATLAVALLRDLTGKDTSSMSQEARSELLRATLEDARQQGQLPALILDESHLISDRGLIALKQIWDAGSLYSLLAVILVGQPMLDTRLRQVPGLRELTIRTRIMTLPALGAPPKPGASLKPNPTGRAYIEHLFRKAGGDAGRVFTAEAIDALCARGQHALVVNNLAVLAMREAFQVGDKVVTLEHVGGVA